ncbi:MFS transporter [Streptomyces sp900105245]|uniref:MFS transporter n=1 Tax=Streptomyces sp. 900105245 TaxID=3154379 RepID=A0ABV1UL37_9ACTN
MRATLVPLPLSQASGTESMYLAGRPGPPSVSPATPGARSERRGAAVPGTVVTLGAVSMVTDASAEMVVAALPAYLVFSLGLSPLAFGLIDGIYNGCTAVIQLVSGHFADRGGGRYKSVAVVGYGLSALCKPALLGVHQLPLIGAVLAIDRTGKAMRTASRDAIISLVTEERWRGRNFGVHRAMDTAGALLGPLLAFLLLSLIPDGYDAVFMVSGCLSAFGVVILVLFVPRRFDPPAVAHASDTPHTPKKSVTTMVTLRRGLSTLCLPSLRRLSMRVMLIASATISDSFIYLLLQQHFQIPLAMLPLLPMGTAAAFLLFTVPIGIARR